MSDYTDRVTRYLEGCTAVSVGLSSECSECADAMGYRDRWDEELGDWIEGSGLATFAADYEAGKVADEGSFSREECGVCCSPLGGTRYVWHFSIPNFAGRGETRHFHGDDCCPDCLQYLANGEEPQEID